ncbi:MAG: hypothetical protein AAFV29_09550, partial [Myxococcota bacterium]
MNADGTLRFEAGQNASGRVEFEYTLSDGDKEKTASVEIENVSPESPMPILLSDRAEIDLSASQNQITVDVLGNDRIPEGVQINNFQAEVIDGSNFVELDYSDDGKVTVTAVAGTIPPGGVDVEIAYSVEDELGATSTSTLTVHVMPAIVGGVNTADVENYDPSSLKKVETDAVFNSTGNSYILYREDESSEWVQIAAQVDGERTASNFLIDKDFDPSSGQFVMMTDSGGGFGGVHALVGTTNAAEGVAISPVVTEAGPGTTNLAFNVGGVEGPAVNDVSIQLTTAPVVTLAPNVDPADPYVPIRDYTFHHEHHFSFNTSIGIRGNTSREFTATISADYLRDNPMTESELVALAMSQTARQARSYAAEHNRTATTSFLRYEGRLEDKDRMTVSNPYDGADVHLVAHGEVVTPPSTGQPQAVAFFVQGDNEIASGRRGDALGRISFEVYPDTVNSDVYDNEDDGGTIELLHAVAYDPSSGETTDLGDEFFIRPTYGLDGEYEIGLESDHSIFASSFEDQTIALKIRATDENGGVYDSTVYFNPTTGTVGGQNEASLGLVSVFNGGDTLTATPTGAERDALMPSVETLLWAPQAESLAGTVFREHILPVGGPIDAGAVLGSLEQAILNN